MNKNAINLLASLTLSVLMTSHAAFADDSSVSCDLEQDRCSGKPLSASQSDKSMFLADKINQDLENLYQKSKAEGKDLKVVVIGRMGSDLTKFKILNDDGGKQTLQNLIDKLINESRFSPSSEVGMQTSDRIEYSALQKQIDKSQSLKYSHLGIAFRNFELKSDDGKDVIAGPGTGKWAFYHLLYSCNKPEGLANQGEYIKSSHIFKGTVHSFFYDHLSGYDAELVIPTQAIQDNLENILLQKRQAYRFQNDHYNAATKFDDLSQQNSNQFVLEALAAAMKPEGVVISRETAIQALKETGFGASKLVPSGLFTVINLPFVQKLISSMMPTVCLKSQPELKKYGIGEIVTANSVVNWMKRNNMVDQVVETSLDKNLMNELDQDEKNAAAKSK